MVCCSVVGFNEECGHEFKMEHCEFFYVPLELYSLAQVQV